MATEAQKEAQKKYRATKVKTITLEFYPSDQDLLAKLSEVDSKQGYIKNLIREDIIKKVTR